LDKYCKYAWGFSYDNIQKKGGLDDPPTDAQLHTTVMEIKRGQPELGEVMIMGQIRSMSYKVTQVVTGNKESRSFVYCTKMERRTNL